MLLRKRRWVLGAVLAGSLLAGGIFVGAIGKQAQAQSFSIELATGWYQHDGIMKAGWKEHFGVESDEGIRLRANLVLKPTTEASVHSVAGDVQVFTPNGAALPIILGQNETLKLKKLRDGRAVFDGSLFGKIRSGRGQDEDVVMNVTFMPGTDLAMMTLSVSSGSHATELVFGKSFITADEARWLWGQKGDD